jgi:hypothetical protein
MLAVVRRYFPLIAICCVAFALGLVGACSSSMTPGPTATSTPASITESLPAAGQPLVFPNHAGFSGQLIVPSNNAPAGTSVTVTVYTSPPPGAPAQDASRHSLTIYRQPMALPSGTIPIFLGELDFSQAVGLANAPQVTITVPGHYSTSNYYFTLELWITTGNPQFTWSDPTISGQTLTFPQGTGPLGVDTATYWLYLYATPIAPASPSPSPSASSSPSPSPSPSPSVTPSAKPSPSPSPSVTPSASPSPTAAACNPVFSTCVVTVSTAYIVFANVPPAQWGCGTYPGSTNFTASESGYTGSFSASSTNTQAATVTQTAPNAFTATDVWTYPDGQSGPDFIVYVSDTKGNTTEIFGDFNAECLP